MSELKKTPALDRLTKADYEEMLEMSSSRRQKYYHYLFATQTADARDEVYKLCFQTSSMSYKFGIEQSNQIICSIFIILFEFR